MSVPQGKSFDITDRELVAVFDELPLWSAPFGLLFLDTVKLRAGITVLDVGCGFLEDVPFACFDCVKP